MSSVKALTQKSIKIALVGNPNCGKTTLFNALTGNRQKVGNWPGVTVEKKTGTFVEENHHIEVIDLPGLYSSTLYAKETALDEEVACRFILEHAADIFINILDASNLERHLYLTIQLREMGVPIILALNMMDVVQARHMHIDLEALADLLGCPVIALQANKRESLKALKEAIINYRINPSTKIPTYPKALQDAIDEISVYLGKSQLPTQIKRYPLPWLALRLLEEDMFVKQFSSEIGIDISPQQQSIQQTLGEDGDIMLADARYQFIEQIINRTISYDQNSSQFSLTKVIDRFVLNRFLGVPIFLMVMYSLFFFSINIGGAFQDFFDMTSQTIFVDGLSALLVHTHMPTWLTVLLANGVGKGINTTVTFIPVIGAMFLFLALLEDSGYMARAAFVIDRFMRLLGLPGKAFVPMIVGFGCNVPGIMAARNLENKQDRILTIMMSPFMSCGARLAIYAVFTAAFFPRGGQNVIFALYLTGIFMAILTGFILRKTVLRGEPSPLIMELPLYHRPHLTTLCLHAWQRLKGFVFRAGKLIVPICVLIGALNSLNVDGTIGTAEGDVHSLLSTIGQWVTPIFTPMGITIDNWPATVGLVTGVLAKEVVIGTLNTLYTQMGNLAALQSGGFDLWGGLAEAVHSIPNNFSQLLSAFSNPILAQAPIDEVNQGVYGLMYQRFDGQIGAFAYLLFVLLYFPCISTTAVMLKELNVGWSIFSILWMTGIAYGAAVIFYQAATWHRHQLTSSLWILSISILFFSIIFFIRKLAAPTKQWMTVGESI